MLSRPSLPCALAPSRAPRHCCGRRSLWSRHASFAQTVLACSETGASVTPWSLTAAARQLSSQAAELALRGMPRPFSATAAWQDDARCSLKRKNTLRKGLLDGQTARFTHDAARTATDALPKGIRGHSTTRERSDRDCHAVTISDAPSAATERPCAARLWESRRRHEQRVRRRVPAPPSDGRERERNLVERARPRSQGPRAREDGAERTLAPWWSERVRAAGGRGRERTARCEQLATEGARGRRRAHTRALVERATVPVCSAQKRNRLGRVPEAGMRLRGLEPPRVLPH